MTYMYRYRLFKLHGNPPWDQNQYRWGSHPQPAAWSIPEVMIGVIPSSMSVPRLNARMTRIQYSGSDKSEDMIPYNGTCEHNRKIRRVLHKYYSVHGMLLDMSQINNLLSLEQISPYLTKVLVLSRWSLDNWHRPASEAEMQCYCEISCWEQCLCNSHMKLTATSWFPVNIQDLDTLWPRSGVSHSIIYSYHYAMAHSGQTVKIHSFSMECVVARKRLSVLGSQPFPDLDMLFPFDVLQWCGPWWRAHHFRLLVMFNVEGIPGPCTRKSSYFHSSTS